MGQLQRDEFDAIITVVRTDSLNDMIAIPCTQGLPAEHVIISRQLPARRNVYTLFQLWTSSFDQLMLLTMINTLVIFAIILTVAQKLTTKMNHVQLTRGKMMTFMRKLVINMSHMLLSFADHGNFDTSGRMYVKFLILCFYVFIMFAFHGIILGCLGADQVAWVFPPIIESLEEFTIDSLPKPYIAENLWLEPVLRAAVPGSELWNLKTVIYSDPAENIFDVPTESGKGVTQVAMFMKDIKDGKKARINSAFWERSLHPIACILDVEYGKMEGISKNMFAAGVMTPLMSTGIDPGLRILFNYMMGTFFETGHHLVIVRDFNKVLLPQYADREYAPYDCKMDHEYDPTDDDTDFTVMTFKPLLTTFAVVSFACFVHLMIEVSFHHRIRIACQLRSILRHMIKMIAHCCLLFVHLLLKVRHVVMQHINPVNMSPVSGISGDT
jgi:hypothetical protein